MIKLKSLIQETDDEMILMYELKVLEHHLKDEFPQIQNLSLVLRGKDHIFINQIRVRPKDRGKGIGAEIIRRISQFADERGMYISLHPVSDNPRKYKKKLEKFYKKMGYRVNAGRRALHQYSHPFMRTFIKEPKPKV